jgi:hypothetical protein
MRDDDSDSRDTPNRRDDDSFAERWPSPTDAGANGHGASPYAAEEEDELPTGSVGAGRWVSRGGVMAWEEPEAAPETTANEAELQWAADELELPPGAPAGARIRAVRAWLLARRQAENEALGMLLLEQRRMQPTEDESRFIRRGPVEESPLELAMAEHQAAVEEYERLYEALAELEAHNGPQRLLVEFYLTVSDRLAELANAPEAPPDFAPALRVALPAGQAPRPPTRRGVAEWQGRASAVTQARRRIERMTTPETEE